MCYVKESWVETDHSSNSWHIYFKWPSGYDLWGSFRSLFSSFASLSIRTRWWVVVFTFWTPAELSNISKSCVFKFGWIERVRCRVAVNSVPSTKYCLRLCFTYLDVCLPRSQLASSPEGMWECAIWGYTGYSSNRKGIIPYDGKFMWYYWKCNSETSFVSC